MIFAFVILFSTCISLILQVLELYGASWCSPASPVNPSPLEMQKKATQGLNTDATPFVPSDSFMPETFYGIPVTQQPVTCAGRDIVLYVGVTCFTCAGRDIVLYVGVTCFTCAGRGIVLYVGITCFTCAGRGIVLYVDVMCFTCAGRGIVLYVDVMCFTCAGKGYSFVC